MEDRPKSDKLEDLSPYERFREFARRIIAVPKAEIDEQQDRYNRQRAEKKQLRSSNGAR